VATTDGDFDHLSFLGNFVLNFVLQLHVLVHSVTLFNVHNALSITLSVMGWD